jgi:hypothetical protein
MRVLYILWGRKESLVYETRFLSTVVQQYYFFTRRFSRFLFAANAEPVREDRGTK